MPLREELDLVIDYLEIAKTRFRERLSYAIDVEPGLEAVAVPPLTVQGLVENSLKHAVLPSPTGGDILVSARRRAGTLVLTVRDSGPGFTAEMLPPGGGMDNLSARLSALYGGSARLSIGCQDGASTVAVTLPVEEAVGR